MQTFTQDELKNISVLIQRADIKGGEALATAMLLQKINTVINTPAEEPNDEGTAKKQK